MKPKLRDGASVQVIAEVLRIIPREKVSEPSDPIEVLVDVLTLPGEKAVLSTTRGEVVYTISLFEYLRPGDRVTARIKELYLGNESLGHYVDGHVVKI